MIRKARISFYLPEEQPGDIRFQEVMFLFEPNALELFRNDTRDIECEYGADRIFSFALE